MALTATLMSLVALSVDTVLPALGAISRDLGIVDDNSRQWIITALLAGLGAGQLVYGPLSDRYGRKPMVYLGLFWFAVGSAVSALSQSLETMLVGRVLQGFGAAGPRVVTTAMVRDPGSRGRRWRG